mmetsp:Transcript_16693/g.34308  ORF Transcript_16693/g.34308 Transcript_16693/m.34308 type:complete len:80 (+) Transcript_16693:4378-4617(+)
MKCDDTRLGLFGGRLTLHRFGCRVILRRVPTVEDDEAFAEEIFLETSEEGFTEMPLLLRVDMVLVHQGGGVMRQLELLV